MVPLTSVRVRRRGEMDTDEDAYVLMVSGLNVGSSENIHLSSSLGRLRDGSSG